MAKEKSKPLMIKLILSDGRINSSDGIIMFDSILYHAWFLKHAPHVLEGGGQENYDGNIGLPLVQLPGNRWAASKGIFETDGLNIEHYNRRPNFFNPDKTQYLKDEKGIISEASGLYRAYRMPQIIRTVKFGQMTFYAVGRADGIMDLLDRMTAVGKKASMGYGAVQSWAVEEAEHDYSSWHPAYGLMRPHPVDEPTDIDLSSYPVMMWATKPPYWKQKNKRLCYVPIGQ